MIKKIMIASSVFSAIALTACATAQQHKAETSPMLNMANPASVYCEKLGGKSVIKKGPNGDTGYCHLANGKVVEEWELYYKDHPTK